MSKLRSTHLTETGEARMVDIGDKPATAREAVARATVHLSPATLDAIEGGQAAKGDVYAAARIAGIMASKRTPELIPLCHPVALTHCEVHLEAARAGDRAAVVVTAVARTTDRTGVEMEALVAASTAALTVYDMCKSMDRAMVIADVMVIEKRGGKSGEFVHPRADAPAL